MYTMTWCQHGGDMCAMPERDWKAVSSDLITQWLGKRVRLVSVRRRKPYSDLFEYKIMASAETIIGALIEMGENLDRVRIGRPTRLRLKARPGDRTVVRNVTRVKHDGTKVVTREKAS